MRSLMLQMVMHAQAAASKFALEEIKDCHLERYGRHKPLNAVKIHREAIALVKEAGFPGFLCQSSDIREIKPLWHGKVNIGNKNSSYSGESWQYVVIYERSEVEAFAERINKSWFKDIAYAAEVSRLKKGDTCPECHDGFLAQAEHDNLHCRLCGCDYPSEIGALQILGDELTGMCAHYNGPGRTFSNAPFTKLSKNGRYIIVKQTCGLDI